MHELDDIDHRALHLLYDTSGIGFWRIDQAGYTLSVNPAMLVMLEASSIEELQGKTWRHFATPESLEKVNAEHVKRNQGMSSTYQVEMVGLRGTHRHLLISGVPVKDPDGKVIGMFGTFADITETKRNESALRSSENRLRSVISASVDAIGVSRNGIHLMVNPAYVRMFGAVSEKELEGTSILDLIAPDQRATITEYVRLRFSGQTDRTHYMTRGLRRDGREFPMEVHVSGYEEADGLTTVVILRDLTNQLSLEEQLRQSQKMDALGRLAGGVAHDFNNLLTVIMSCADLALRALPSGVAADNVQLIRSTGERGATLTRQLLALSRRQVIDPKVTDLNSVVSELATMLRRLLGSHIKLVVETEPLLAHVRVDVGQLQQVIMNLCLNGRDAMPDGGTLEIRTHTVDGTPALLDAQAGPYAVISVRDYGYGMSAEVQNRMFEPFFTTKPPGRGTGLGLSTVYGIVKQSGGHITVDTVVGEGTTFHVYLPAVEDPAAEWERTVVTPGLSKTVLLVEDEAMLRELITQFLRQTGYRVISAANGEQALKRFREHRDAIDIIVTDMLMPELSGVELMKTIDTIEPNMRVLFMSGYAMDGASILTSRPGSAFLAKPFTLPDLVERVRGMLAEAKAFARDR